MLLHKILAASICALVVINCSKNPSDPAAKPGHLVVHLTDAPANYSEVNITFAEISAHIDSQWVVVSTEQQKINLLEWNNGRSIVLGEADVPAGRYNQIRLKIVDADVVYNGQSFPMDVPSGATSGLKLGPAFTVESGVAYELMIDFDAERSVVSNGPPNNPNGFKLKPHIRVVPVTVSGSISGTVTNPQHVPIAYAIQGTDTLTSSRVDTLSGNFKLGFLPTGSYTVTIEDTLRFKFAQTGVQVTAGADISLGEVTLAP